jgi:prophage DNA circulation protein
MGAPTPTQNGKLDDITLEMETIEDNFEKSIPRYEYPFADGPDLDDMGEKAHTLTIRCYFWDAGMHLTFDNHIDLITALAQKSDWTLFHPIYGFLIGKVEKVGVRFNDRQRTAEVDISFVEQMREALAIMPATDVTSAVEGAFLDAQDEQQTEISSDLVALGLDPTVVYDPTQSILSQLSGASASMRGIAKAIDSYIGMFSTIASEITQPVNSLVATITYPTTIPGIVVGTLTQCVERVAREYDSSLGFPARFLGNLDLALNQLAASTNSFSTDQSASGVASLTLIAKHLQLASAQRLALETAYCYADDEENRQQVRQIEQTSSFDVLGQYTTQPVPPIMTVNDLETTLATSRTWLQSGIDQARSMQSLKTLALQLLQNVSSVKLESELIITVHVVNPIPLHLLCLQYGLPYNYAERIASINKTMEDPNFVSGAVQIYTLPGGAS